MPKELEKQYNPHDIESNIYRIWTESGFFNPDNLPPRHTKPFTIVIPPPNITGSLHMGHALNATIQDILIRKRRMEGYKTLWLPGTDHAGIATQNVVEKQLKKDGTSRHTLGKEKFIEKIWEWKEQYGNTILEQLKKLGSSLDWSRTRFTMDDDYQEAVKEAFLHYHKKGLLYKAEKVINWCTRCATSLSDLELEYEEVKSKLYYIKYPIKNSKDYITVATTRPETMLGDTAVAVNPKDTRYKDMVGKTLILPIHHRDIPIIADEKVEKEFGTGAVKVTPAHDLLDAEIGERHNLPILKVIGPDGKMTTEAGAICNGLKVNECRKKVIEALKQEHAFEKEEDYTHNVARCHRCATPIEPMPSMQWFLKMKDLAQRAIEEVESGRIVFHPKRWEKVYFDWLKNIKDWTISRQIWWGHQLPVWYCMQDQTGRISNSQFPISKPMSKNENLKLSAEGGSAFGGKIENSSADEQFMVSLKKPEQCPFCGHCKMEQSADVLDTWFSSALWPFATLGWPFDFAQGKPKPGSNLATYYPTQVLSTARDIVNLWVARMIFSGMEFMGDKPFTDIIIHATVLTKDGKRMSKSLGTGIDPMTLIEKYGSDATRFGLIWQTMGNQDVHWSEEHVRAGKKFLNKIWNASRFVLQQIGISNEQFLISPPEADLPQADNQFPKSNSQNITSSDKNVLERFEHTKKTVNMHIDTYEFGHALHELYDFFWHTYCDTYLEHIKTTDKEESKKVLLYVLSESLKLLHPFIPHITEHIWAMLPHKDKKMLIIEEWPE
ncbi:MAG: valine--tRNA ligase [bacterium]|nr:valine--tRNA ligase [bacterium]